MPIATKSPHAERRPTQRDVHGVTLHDDYAWLRADNWRDVLRDPDTLPGQIRAHLVAENAYCEASLASLAPLRQQLVEEMRGRIKEDDSSPPAPYGNFVYSVRYRPGAEHPLICRAPREGGDEQILLDAEAMARDAPFFQLADWEMSPDHSLMVYGTDLTGSELFTLRVRDTATGLDQPDRVETTAGDAVWRSDGKAFFYVRLDENHRPRQVFRHVLGEPAEDDVLIFEEKDPGWFVHIGKSRCGTHLIIHLHASETSEAWLADRSADLPIPRVVAPREEKLRYSVEAWGNTLFILTNADGAVDFKIVTASAEASKRANWRDLIVHRPGTMILSHTLFSGHLVRTERRDALPSVVIRALAFGDEHAIAMDEEAYSIGVQPGFEGDTQILRFSCSSPARPSETFDYDMESRERTLVKRQEVPSGHDPDAYVVRRLWADARDGERVPVTILHRRGLKLDGSAPCLLYGYGAYGHAIPAGFSTSRLSLVDRGFVYAIAHIRGGTERGWNWYLDGKLSKKTNTFHDFIACGEALVKAGYTSQKKIVAHGGSAGGMLMGAVANLAPALFAGIVAEVPFVDVLNTMLDAELPLTPPEWTEWGNPIEDISAFRTIGSYSPYDQVAPKTYPAILAMAGLTDPRVTYWEPAKWIARLRATATGGGPFLLRTNMEAGHAGASGRFKELEETAFAYAFALEAAGRADEVIA